MIHVQVAQQSTGLGFHGAGAAHGLFGFFEGQRCGIFAIVDPPDEADAGAT